MPHLRLHRSSRERVVIAFVSFALIVAGVGLLAVLPCCDTKAPAPTNARGPAAATYTVRGKIEALPTATEDLSIRHEAIAAFTDKGGKVVGMGSMVMPFPVAKGVSLDGLSVGDVAEFDFSVWWQPRVAYEVTRVAALPKGTTLNFGPAPAPGP